MVGAALRIDPQADEALWALGQLAARLGNPRGLWDDIGLSLVTSTQRRFEQGRAPDGSPWPPSLRARLTGGKTLVDTARLMQSITFQASDTGVEVGTNVIYAAIHQLGGTIRRLARTQTIYRRYDARNDELSSRFVKRRRSNFAQDVKVGAHDINMPARPFLGIDEEDRAAMTAIVGDWLTRAAGGSDAGR